MKSLDNLMEGWWSSLTHLSRCNVIYSLRWGYRLGAFKVVLTDTSWVSHNPLRPGDFFYVAFFVRWVGLTKVTPI